ncbi:exodeoxyribonuclease VII large subunit [Alkalihalobacillus oceani]|uniref:exodeoxyribonuclease VII large subunit n=1 Tax=Halalkalibacter oceani TaxID=1653776 RepID=UPI00203EE64F|nr:exodeoxyribonuclease VII large subunit [Halalkalibacter oceani]MCM3762755.1 exodeoxyribonuclease VII large subunit [Halalkalibacter oceani]
MKAQDIYTILEATRYIKAMMEEDVLLQDIWLRGELSNVKWHSRGHLYFTIKDDQSRMQAVMFAGHNRYLAFRPENGMKVLLRGEINVYEPYGQYQFYAKEMQPDGIGSLYLAYEELKEKLQAEGLFDAGRKRAIPAHPKRIAIITSPTGAAIQDIYTTLKRRYQLAQLTLFPVLVQGEQAPGSIVAAIEQASAAGCFDVMIVGRGGGSIEELWAFNDEQVARTIAAATVPVISAVGHETDYTISDFVADLRAPTPTAAAELAVPDQQELTRMISALERQLIRGMKERLERETSRLSRLQRSYAFRYPGQLVRQKEQELDGLIERLKRAMKYRVAEPVNRLNTTTGRLKRLHPDQQLMLAKERTERLEQALIKSMQTRLKSGQQAFQKRLGELQLLSPLRLMDRGYSLVYDEQNKLLKSVAQVELGQPVQIQFQDGEVNCRVEDKQFIARGEKE